jgi:serine/threonine-protein kinase
MNDSTDPITRLNAALEGRYRIERELGEGGMATVYLADDLKHERKVALKVLKPELAAVVGAERFLAEIKTTANLQHPHILPLFDSGEADTYLFYVMPYVEGETLRDRLDRDHQLPVDEAVQIAKNVAEALDYAHGHGVIHRDIKPANILLQSGKPVLSDFGIALAVGVAGGGRLTETGLSLGTPHYMSPEQATGDLSVGAATDIYALGCVLYEMLVGEPPHTGGTAQAILGKIVMGDAEPATKHRKSVPANVDAAIRKSLEKVPADRFSGAQDFVRALTDLAFRHGPATEDASIPSSPWNRLTIGMTGLTAVLATTTIWLLAGPGPVPTPEVTRLVLTPPEGMTIAPSRMAISPDGRTVVLADTGQLYRRDLDRLGAVPIPGTAAHYMPFFSPDGEWLAFFDTRENTLVRVRLDGSGLQTITEAPATARSGAWGEDGTIVFASTGLGGLSTVSAGGGASQPVANSPPVLLWLDLLPGGAAVIASGRPFAGYDEFHVVLVPLETGEPEVLFPGTWPRYVGGHIVYWRDEAIWAVPFDVDRLQVNGEPTMLVQGVRGAQNGHASFVVSERVLVYQGGGLTSQFYGMPVWIDREGNEEPLNIDPGLYAWPRISPDGSSVTLVRLQDNEDVWIHDVQTGVSSPLTVDEATDQAPIWTPDGERIVFRSTRDGASNLYWRRADGSNEVERLTESPNDQRPVAVTPDGSTLLFEDFDESLIAHGLWALPLQPPGEPVRLTRGEFAETHPTMSPGGEFIAYQSSETGYPEIFVRTYPDLIGGRMISTLDIGAQISAPGADPREARAPVWSRDGSKIFYQSGQAVVSVPVTTEGGFSAGSPQVAFSGTQWPFVGEGRHYDEHPDGQRFLRIRLEEATGSSAPADVLIVVRNWMEELRQRTGN